MGASACKQECQFRVVLLPYHQPIWPQVAFPATCIVPCQLVGAIGSRQLPTGREQTNGRLEQFHIKSSFATPFRIFTESARHLNFVFHILQMPNDWNISSADENFSILPARMSSCERS